VPEHLLRRGQLASPDWRGPAGTPRSVVLPPRSPRDGCGRSVLLPQRRALKGTMNRGPVGSGRAGRGGSAGAPAPETVAGSGGNFPRLCRLREQFNCITARAVQGNESSRNAGQPDARMGFPACVSHQTAGRGRRRTDDTQAELRGCHSFEYRAVEQCNASPSTER
jgi:hypothetical protein